MKLGERDFKKTGARLNALRGLKKTLRQSFDKARDRGELPGKGSGHRVFFTTEQWDAIAEAIRVMRENEEPPRISEAQAIELMAAEYYAGAKHEPGEPKDGSPD